MSTEDGEVMDKTDICWHQGPKFVVSERKTFGVKYSNLRKRALIQEWGFPFI